MLLSNADRAVVDIEKLRDYSLNPNHPEGKHKARLFLDKLGFTTNDAPRLRNLVLEAILTSEAKEQPSSQYGRRFIVDFGIHATVKYVQMTASVRSAWIIRNDEDFPRLTTCFVLPRRS